MTPPAGQRWTRSKPKQEGYYWWRNQAKDYPGPYIVDIITMHDSERYRLVACFTNNCREWVDDMNGQFLGPLTPNEATE